MAHQHSVYDSDTHFSINPITRALKNEASGKTSLIQYDHNCERFTFEIPRMIEGHDMSLCNRIRVHYINIDARTKGQVSGVYEVNDMQISPDGEDVVICSWLISRNATQFVGSLQFLIRFECITDDNVVEYAWNTAVYNNISVSSGINADETFETDYVDVIEQWKASAVQEITEESNANVTAWQEAESANVRAEMTSFSEGWNATLDVERVRIDNMLAMPNTAEEQRYEYVEENFGGGTLTVTIRTVGTRSILNVRLQNVSGGPISNNYQADYRSKPCIPPALLPLQYHNLFSGGIVHEEMVYGYVGVCHFALLHPSDIYADEEDTGWGRIAVTVTTEDWVEDQVFSAVYEQTQIGVHELTDIRVGADGTVYDSAGTAVREQIRNNNQRIANLESAEIPDGTITPEKTTFVEVEKARTSLNMFDADTMVAEYHWYHPTTGKLTALTGANDYGAVTIPLNGEKFITLSYDNQVGAYLYNYLFVDADGETVSAETLSTNRLYNGITLTVPANAVTFCGSIGGYSGVMVEYGANLMVAEGNTKQPYDPYSFEAVGLRIPLLLGVDAEDNREMRLGLPEKYDLVVGDTFELFYKGFMLCKDPYQYNILVDCNIGNAYGRKYSVTPTADDVGTHTLTVTVTDDFGAVLAEKSVTLNVVNKATSPAENINVLCVGDSLTKDGIWVDEVYRRLTKTTNKTQHDADAPTGDGLTNITFVGKKTTANGAGYEGTGGWTYDSYTDTAKSGNPFVYNGAVDFNAYCADLGIDHIDICYILLGWNMTTRSEVNFKEKANALIDLLIAHNANIKIVLVGVQIPFLDGLGENYGTVTQSGVLANYRALQEFVFNLDKWNADIAGEHPNNITSINVAGQFDTEYGGITHKVAPNKRSTKTVNEQNNGVHPNTEGQYQIADAVYRKFTADNA